MMIYGSALMAFLHHLAAFTLVSTLVAEVITFKPPLTILQARRLRRIDITFGISALVLLVVGLLRVFFFEKGAHYYFHNSFFHLKVTAFIVTALISIYPTRVFLSWGRALRQGLAPEMPPEQVKRVRMCLMWELTGIVIILFAAPMMARGFGYHG